MKPSFFFHYWYRTGIKILNLDIGPAFDGKDDLIDLILGPLNLHRHRGVVFVPYPAGTTVHIRGVACAVPETDALYLTIENNALAKNMF